MIVSFCNVHLKASSPYILTPTIVIPNRLAELDFELDTLKRQVSDLRSENDWLQREADKSKDESVCTCTL